MLMRKRPIMKQAECGHGMSYIIPIFIILVVTMVLLGKDIVILWCDY